jgi:hypothetical protein
MTNLTPRWKDGISLKMSAAPAGEKLFDPVAVEQRGVLIAGGPLALAVFTIGDRQRLWYNVKARVWITAFTATAGALYVQDGPVLSGWHLTEERCFAAVNLVTDERWAPESDDDEQTEPPDELYELPADSAVLQNKLLTARTTLASASLLANSSAFPEVEKNLAEATAAADSLIFSAPAVRDRQFEGGSGRIFSLGMDGQIVALTDDLEISGKFTHENHPIRPDLAMAELPQPGGKVLCYLYYVGKDGAIVAMDGTDGLKKHPAGWQSTGQPVGSKVLPLQYHDGLLFGGGILGADFFVMTLDPAAPPRLTAAGPSEGWRTYQIATADKLVLLSNGTVSRLVSYDSAAKERDRWGERRVPRLTYSTLWPGTGSEGVKPSPKLAIEVDAVAPDGSEDVGFNVLLANTVDSVDPRCTSTYPPPASVLLNGSLGGKGTELPKIGQIRCRPLVVQHALYCVARPGKSGPSETPDMLVAYSIAPVMTSVADAAEAALQTLRIAAQPLRVRVNRITDYKFRRPDHSPKRKGPSPAPNLRLLMVVTPPGSERSVQTDGNASANFDTALAGAEVKVSSKMTDGNTRWVSTDEITSAKLEAGKVNSIQFTSHMND